MSSFQLRYHSLLQTHQFLGAAYVELLLGGWSGALTGSSGPTMLLTPSTTLLDPVLLVAALVYRLAASSSALTVSPGPIGSWAALTHA